MSASLDAVQLQRHRPHPGSAASESLSTGCKLYRSEPHWAINSVSTLTGLTSGGTDPWVEVTEQPKTTAMRFRYQCEGRSAGTILGLHSTLAQKTYPSIRVSVRHCVTA